MQNYLLDDFKIRGKNLESLERVAKDYDACTKVVDFDFRNVDVLDYVTKQKGVIYMTDLSTKKREVNFCQEKMVIHSDLIKFPTPQFMSTKDVLINEMIMGERMVFASLDNQNDIYFVSKTFWKTYNGKQKSLGGSFLSTASSKRNLSLSFAINEDYQSNKVAESVFKVLMREQDGVRKLFAVYTDRFKLFRLQEIVSVMKNLNANVLHWKINQKETEIYFELDTENKTRDFIPGYALVTSDTGHTATTISSTIRKKDSKPENYFVVESQAIRHSTSVSFEDIKETILTLKEKQYQFIDKFVLFRMNALKEGRSLCTYLSKKYKLEKRIGVKKSTQLVNKLKDQPHLSCDEIFEYYLSLNENEKLSEHQKDEYKLILQSISMQEEKNEKNRNV